MAGTVKAVGDGVDSFAVDDDVLGFTDDRASHAGDIVVQATNIVHKPPEIPWEQAGGLKIAGTTAYASVRAVDVGEGDVVVVSGAAGGVGSLAVQLSRLRGATVIALAGKANHDWLTEHGAIAVNYGEPDLAEAITAAGGGGVDAFLDTFGGGYIELALAERAAAAHQHDHRYRRCQGARHAGGGWERGVNAGGARRAGRADGGRAARGPRGPRLSPRSGRDAYCARAAPHPGQDRARPLTLVFSPS